MNFIDFIKAREEFKQNTVRLNEAFKTSDIDKVHNSMLSIFKRKISNKVLPWGWLDTTISGNAFNSYFFIDLEDHNNPKMWALNYLTESGESEVYSISFFNTNTSNKFLWSDSYDYKADLTINTLGTSVAYFIPIICHIVKNGDYSISKEAAAKLGSQIFNKGMKNENREYNFGNVTYNIYERLSEEDIKTIYMESLGYVKESTEAQEYRWKKKKERDEAFNKMKSSKSDKDKKNYERIQNEYKEIVDAIRGGALTIEDIKMSISKNTSVSINVDEGTDEAESEMTTRKKDPKQAFKEMQVYVKTVIKGLQPGVILCGAPGIGKTYRILQQLKAAGYNDGHNMEIIKGKCTPRQLYLSLYNYKERGNIVVIDDADALVGPKAPEDCINMLKAALDSTSTPEGRKVSYRVSGKILDDEGEEIPKTLYYNGGVIVITNYSVGQLDSALKGRTFIQSLDFSTEQILDIIKDLLPNIDPTHLTTKSKIKALNYLYELVENGSDLEISIRTFSTCARLFAVCEDDDSMSDDDVKSMIKEQMENQTMRGGKKF